MAHDIAKILLPIRANLTKGFNSDSCYLIEELHAHVHVVAKVKGTVADWVR